MRIAVLGPLAVDGVDVGLAPRDRVVLSALATRRGEACAADRIADALWPQRPPATWAKIVQGCVVRLRKTLGAGSIDTVPNGYRLTVPAEEVDAAVFERLVGRAREMLAIDEPERASYFLAQALELWRGPALPDLAEWHAGQVEALRLDELRLEAEELRLEAALRAGGCLVYEPVSMHDGFIQQVEWTLDGETIATSGVDGRIALYDAHNDIVRAVPLPGSSDPRVSANLQGYTHLRPDIDGEIVALSGERTGHVYPLDPAVWLAQACAIVGRDLTQGEWARYLPDRPYRPTCSSL